MEFWFLKLNIHAAQKRVNYIYYIYQIFLIEQRK